LKDFSTSKILLVDDNEEFLNIMMQLGKSSGFTFTTCSSPLRAINLLSQEEWDVVITDITMPEMSGLELFRIVQDHDPRLPVIIITQYGSTEGAVEALKEGAYHYFEKPIRKDQELFWKTLREAAIKMWQERELERLRKERTLEKQAPAEILGISENIQEVKAAIREVAKYEIDLLITGETGTGKGLVARAIHDLSPRREGVFLTVNSAELPETLIESALFGYEKGAYTGAATKGQGYFEMVNGGTLFLDEIGDASPALQTKLLRVLEEKTYQRVGGSERFSSDFRLITATNMDLMKAIENGAFRRDLYHRINIYTIHLDPLRTRKEDISILARFFCRQLRMETGIEVVGITSQAEDLLYSYHWPGNVRELRNVVLRASVSCRGKKLRSQDIARHIPIGLDDADRSGSLQLKEMERRLIRLALVRTENNQTLAAKQLGVSRNTLISKIKAYGLEEELDSIAQNLSNPE